MKKLEKMIRNANEGARYWSLEGEKALMKHLENMQDENDFEIQENELDRNEYLEIEVEDFKKEYLNMEEENNLDYADLEKRWFLEGYRLIDYYNNNQTALFWNMNGRGIKGE